MRIALISLLFLLAAACSGSDGDAPTPLSGDTRDLVPRTILTDWSVREMRMVDPESLAAIPGLEPIESGHHASHFTSPDGRLSLSWISPDQGPNGVLHLIDLAEWRVLFTLEEPVGGFYPVAWSPDNERAYFGDDQQLWVLDIGGEDVSLLTTFEQPPDSSGFQARRMDVSPDGSRLYLFAYNKTDTNTSTPLGDPFVIAFDAQSGDEIGRVPLPDVLVGWRTSIVDGEELGMSYSPGLAMSPDGKRYYVAHPEENRLTVIDLDSLQIERVATPEPEKSLFERALGVFVSDAEAKSSNGNAKTILTSPDGSYLYIAESRSLDPPAEIAQEGKLTIVEADTMNVVHQQEGPTSIVMTQDGSRLLAWGLSFSWVEGEHNAWTQRDHVGYGVTVYDAATGEIEHRVGENGLYGWIIPGGDGRHAYVFDYFYNDGESFVPDCEMPCQIVHVLDLETGSFTAEHRLQDQPVALMTTGYLAD